MHRRVTARRFSAWLAPLMVLVSLLAAPLAADEFTFEDEDGKTVEIEARLVGSGQGAHLLELDDGRYRIVPEGAVLKRVAKEGPQPVTADAVIANLEKKFGEERFRAHTENPFVLGLVLSSPLPRGSDARATNFLRRAGKFMKNVEAAFQSFVKEARLPAKPPTHPLVVLIFESESDFEKYANEITGGRGLSARNISGFYSGLTNYLAIRLVECRTFDVPLHEAIHQQVYNRNVFQRLAPVPHWFDEGIATGFEANEGKINIGPTKISARYARQSIASRELSWEEMMSDDSVFAGDVLAGEAYGHAWGLHWLMVTKYKAEYGKYVRMLAQKEALVKETPEQRLADFRAAFGKSLAELEQEFRPQLEAGLKRQRVNLNPERRAGISLTHEGMAEVELTAVRRLDRGGELEVQGKLTNTSPLRPMTFHVTVETDAGTYAEWLVRNVEIAKSSILPVQYVEKVMQNVRSPGASRTFRVRVRSSAPDSEEAIRWSNGDLPVPVYE